jgi:transcriptional regulator with XRE-family HTH domain
MNNEYFCNRLKNFFVGKGMSQRRIADDLGTSQPYVAKLLNGTANFGRQQALKFEQLYGLSSAWLMTGEGEMMRGVPETASKVEQTAGDGGTNHIEGGVHVGGDLMAVIESQSRQIESLTRMLERKDEQIADLLGLLKR